MEVLSGQLNDKEMSTHRHFRHPGKNHIFSSNDIYPLGTIHDILSIRAVIEAPTIDKPIRSAKKSLIRRSNITNNIRSARWFSLI